MAHGVVFYWGQKTCLFKKKCWLVLFGLKYAGASGLYALVLQTVSEPAAGSRLTWKLNVALNKNGNIAIISLECHCSFY